MRLEPTSVMILLGLQLAAFSWRLVREINDNEPHPFPWVPLPDNVNVGAMLAVVYFCIVAPMTTTGLRLFSVGIMGRAAFAAAVVLLVFHPLVVASHYRLWSGRRQTDEAKLPYCNAQELFVQLVALVAAAVVFVLIVQASNAPTVVLPPR